MSDLKSAAMAAKAGLGGGAGTFSLDFTSVAGRRFGNTPEWESRLVVDDKGSASYFRRRGPGDSAEFPPGRFEGTLSREDLGAFLDMLARVEMQSEVVEPPGPRDPINVLRLILMGRCFEYSWGGSKHPVPESFQRLKDRLRDWSLNGCPIARWSLSLAIGTFQCLGGHVLSGVRVENHGSDSIWLAHPASPGFGSAFGLFLKYGELALIREGFTPLPGKARFAAIQQPRLHVPEFLEVAPARPLHLDFSAQLEGEAPRGWAGKFAFQHYLSEDSVAGLPVFNGALFTEEMKW